MVTRWMLSTVAAAAAVAGASHAQPPATPLDRAVESRADAPTTAEVRPVVHDPDFEAIIAGLSGTFVAEASAEHPALRLSTSAVTVSNLDNAVYFELARADAPATPFRQGVLHLYRFKGELRLRVFDVAGNPGLKDTLTGLWAAPDHLPTLTLASLDPNLDLVMSKSAAGGGTGSWTGTTPHPFPVARDGAVEMTASISIADGGELRISETGIGPDGVVAWGSRPGGTTGETVFRRTAAPAATVTRLDGGLTVITVQPPEPGATQLVENGQIAVHYTGWLTDGTRFDTSRQAGREPFLLRVPGPVIKGWNDGLKGIAKGERRRLIIPSTLAYGERGTRDGRIPPNSTLIFDVECVFLDNTQPPPPAAAPVSPHGSSPRSTSPPTGASGANPTEPAPK